MNKVMKSLKLTHVLETIRILKLTDFIVGFAFPKNITNAECKQYLMTKVWYEHTCYHSYNQTQFMRCQSSEEKLHFINNKTFPFSLAIGDKYSWNLFFVKAIQFFLSFRSIVVGTRCEAFYWQLQALPLSTIIALPIFFIITILLVEGQKNNSQNARNDMGLKCTVETCRLCRLV